MNKLLAGLLGAMLAVPAMAGIYKWQDADGQVHFGEHPPPGVDAERIDARGMGPATPPEDEGTTEADDQPDEQAGDPEAETVEDQDREEALAEACEDVRQNVEILSDESLRRIQENGGDAQILSPEEREERLAEAQAFLEEHC